MRSLFLWIVYGLVCLSVGAQSAVVESQVQVTELEPGVWVINLPDTTGAASSMCSSYLIEGTERALLIDTNNEYKGDFGEIVRRVTSKPITLVLTHTHSDHTGNMQYFDEVFFHPADTLVTFYSDYLKSYTGKINHIYEGHTFDLGNRQFEVFRMPGHTPGSIVFVDAGSGLAFTGDAFGSGQVWLQLLPVSPIIIYRNSCERMLKLMDEKAINRLYTGHYTQCNKAQDRAYILAMKQVAELLVEGDLSTAASYPYSFPIEGQTPMVIGNEKAQIVFDPAKLQ